jgi:16S rRNA (uracil1498-N3)-methyltransferase
VEQDHARRRFFVANLPPREGESAALPPGEAHHAIHVLRLKAGAEVELFDGRGRRAEGVLLRAGRSEAVTEVRRLLPSRPRPQPQVHLGFAVPKGKRLDWLLEKATELGAASLTPVRFERSVAGPAAGARQDWGPAAQDSAALDRWLAHCIAAAKQCGLDFLPTVEPPVGLAAFLALAGAGTAAAQPWHPRILGDAGPAALPLRDALGGWQDGRETCLLVGPEGGLTEAERTEALAAGFVPARLGATTLRTETAAIALLAGVLTVCLERQKAGRGD